MVNKNHHKKWTDAEDFKLMNMRHKGVKYKTIAEKMEKTVNAVSRRYFTLTNPDHKKSNDKTSPFGYLGKHINGVLA